MAKNVEDPVVRSGRREALLSAAIWCVAAAYTVGYCGLYGYGRTAEDLRFVLGIPDWVFWGIVAPWSVCLALGIWFSYAFMTDADLRGEESVAEEGELPAGERDDA